jgi:hypothetical protein
VEAKASFFSIYSGKESFTMKLTKERLVQIIKEEMEAIEEIPMGNPGMSNFSDEPQPSPAAPKASADQPPAIKDRTSLAKELIRLARDEIAKDSGLDGAEATAIHNLLMKALELSSSGSAATVLKTTIKRMPKAKT